MLNIIGIFFAISIFASMKKKILILNSLLVFAVLFSMLFQSIHSYEHLIKQLSEKECHHKYVSSKEITHQHNNFDHCFVCSFTLSSFVPSNSSHFDFKNFDFPSSHFNFKSRETTPFFEGSLFALRAPPSFIV
ncbi:hypothetical protein E0F76_19015 [Flavobacterium cellulosilyticum]|uniref:Uncharacterized protein n=1 Tax=Flavobacterium cellulosilyticum TaxID=2541731 RepID=A0A4V2YYK3_9FLAO|nr:hypothetical protein E0F76_19015 [Flavobacterium cellulosilyticum]